MPGVSLSDALEHERRGRTRLFPVALDGARVTSQLAVAIAEIEIVSCIAA
jgi:hypothetical protein